MNCPICHKDALYCYDDKNYNKDHCFVYGSHDNWYLTIDYIKFKTTLNMIGYINGTPYICGENDPEGTDILIKDFDVSEAFNILMKYKNLTVFL